MVRHLVYKGANVSVIDEYKDSLLHDAIIRNHTQIAIFLIDNGACLFTADKNNETPLQIAENSSNTELLNHIYNFHNNKLPANNSHYHR